LFANVSGVQNVAIGNSALTNTLGTPTTGSRNVAIGHTTMMANTTGDSNTAVGRRALPSNTTGNNNVAVGRAAMDGNSIGSDNVAVGRTGGTGMRASRVLTLGVLLSGLFLAGIAGAQVADDFGTPTIDLTKWQDADVDVFRRVTGGVLELAITRIGSSRSSSLGIADPASVRSVEYDLTVQEATFTGANGRGRPRFVGQFYNDGSFGPGLTGDISVQFQLRADQFAPPGLLRVIASVDQCTNADCSTSVSLLFNSAVFAPVAPGAPHRLKVEWDGNQRFTFTLDGLSLDFVTGVPVAGPPSDPFKGLQVNAGTFPTTPGQGGSARALFDNVVVVRQDGSSFTEDFASPALDPARWNNPHEFVKRNAGGVFESAIARMGSSGNNSLGLLNPTAGNQLEADVRVIALRNAGGAVPQARLFGGFYNDGSPGGGQIGDIQAGVLIGNPPGTSTLSAQFFVIRCTNLDCSTFEFVIVDRTTLGAVTLGTTHRLLLAFDGTTFTFGLDARRATFTPGQAAPNARAAVAPFRLIGTRIGNPVGELVDQPTEGGFIHATFDNFVASAVAPAPPAVGPTVSGNGASESPVVSADGRFVVFEAVAKELAPPCTTGERQVYRQDRQTGVIVCVSVAAGVAGTGPSSRPVVSADGTRIAFETRAANLGSCSDGVLIAIVLRDLTAGTTTCVSAGPGGPANADSVTPAISGDGLRVAFASGAGNLQAPPCGNGVVHVYVWTAATGPVCFSVSATGVAGNGDSFDPTLSGDGLVLGFATEATNLFPPGALPLVAAPRAGRQTGATAQVLLKSTAAASAVATLTSQTAGGQPAAGVSKQPALDQAGATVAFASTAPLTGDCAGGVQQIFVVGSGGTTCVSKGAGGQPGDQPSSQPVLSGNGLVVAFASLATNLVAGVTTGGVSQVFRQNLAVPGAVLELLSQAGGVAGNGGSTKPSLDFTGTLAVFASLAANLAAGDTNQASDIFLTQPALRPTITAPATGTQLGLEAPTPLTVSWTAVAGASQYRFEFTGPNLLFGNPNGTGVDPVNGQGGAGGGLTQAGLGFAVTLDPGFPKGTYQLRVIGLDGNGQPVGTYSDAVALVLGIPATASTVLTAPVDGQQVSVGQPLTFTWPPIAGVVQYGIEFTGPGLVFLNPGAGAPDGQNGFGGAGGGLLVQGQTTLTVTVPVGTPTGSRQFRVIGLSTAGTPVGVFSTAVTVTITAP
jgi:hypothetical protein